MANAIKTLDDLFNTSSNLKVPPYQRAYAWEETQLNQFVLDMIEMKGKRGYYYGHFILEGENGDYEIIDGQQRITTFVLFLMVCQLHKSGDDYGHYIRKFKTVDYDQDAFVKIQRILDTSKTEWKAEDFGFESEQTLSIQRIIFALNFFTKLFKKGKSTIKLDPLEIDSYVEVLTGAHISTHITGEKAVAVQIFELQNTRGIRLNLIEKVKARLMKAIYLKTEKKDQREIISRLQENFAEIYKLEEDVSSSSFRGDLKLEDILLYHLRIVDDGSKLEEKEENPFNEPSKHGDKHTAIMDYLDKQINVEKTKDVVEYITNLVDKFRQTVEFVSKYLPRIDKEKPLVGDVLILERGLSLEFFTLLYHLGQKEEIENESFVRQWERLLFTRDFHDKYYRQKYRDNFEGLFFEICNEGNSVNTLQKYVENGFRPEIMDVGGLQVTVNKYIDNNKETILNKAFYWWYEKMVYLLYKYETEKGANSEELRKIMRSGRSVEHILPQNWKWEWIEEKENNVSEQGREFNSKIAGIIDGIGNLLLVPSSENSSLSNQHPKEKIYGKCSGGSYTYHNENKSQWEKPENWKNIIKTRSEDIYKFLVEFIH